MLFIFHNQTKNLKRPLKVLTIYKKHMIDLKTSNMDSRIHQQIQSMLKRSKSALCQVKLPHGVQVEDIKQISFKLKNKWVQGQAINQQCQVKYHSRAKRGLRLQSPAMIRYRAETQEKFKKQYAIKQKQELTNQKQGLVYKISDYHVYTKGLEKKPTPIAPIVPLGYPVDKPSQPPTPPESTQPKSPWGMVQTFNPSAYKNGDQKNDNPLNKHERRNVHLSNLQILTHVTQDIQKMTKKVQDIRKIVEVNEETHLNARQKIFKPNPIFNEFSFKTPAKKFTEKEFTTHFPISTNLKQPILDKFQATERDPIQTQKQAPGPIWSEVSPHLSRLMGATHTESQYINISKRLDFDKLVEPALNPEVDLRKSTASQRSLMRRPGHLSRSIVVRNDVIDYGNYAHQTVI